MPDNNILNLVKSIPDNEDSTITLTSSEGKRTCYECFYKESEAPGFFVRLASGTEQIPELDLSKPCPFVSKNKQGQVVSFSANIIEKKNDRIVELIAKKSINPEDLRDFFRVNIKTDITVSYQPDPDQTGHDEWELSGKVIDLSQSGVLTMLPEECRNRESILLEIELTEPAKIIYCIGQVVRIKRIRKNSWLTAFHFDDIGQSVVDDIAIACFAEQRRQLRENIQTVG